MENQFQLELGINILFCMKNYVLFLLLFFQLPSVFGQLKVDTLYIDSLIQTSMQNLNIYVDSDSLRRDSIQKLILAIDNFNEKDTFPDFILNPCIDYDERYFWTSLHEPVSLRNILILNTCNYYFLKKIIDSENKLLDVKCQPPFSENPYANFNIEYYYFSTRQMARLRYLECGFK